jgi:hypothetical protein
MVNVLIKLWINFACQNLYWSIPTQVCRGAMDSDRNERSLFGVIYSQSEYVNFAFIIEFLNKYAIFEVVARGLATVSVLCIGSTSRDEVWLHVRVANHWNNLHNRRWKDASGFTHSCARIQCMSCLHEPINIGDQYWKRWPKTPTIGVLREISQCARNIGPVAFHLNSYLNKGANLIDIYVVSPRDLVKQCNI